jgi:hypothetical protein
VTNVVEFQGVSASIAEHCKRLNLPSNRIYNRLSKGWAIERALSEPIMPRAARKRVAAVTACASRPDMPCGYQEALGVPPPPGEIRPLQTRRVLPPGTIAAVAEAARLLQFVEDLLSAPETLPLRSQALRADCRAWRERFAKGGAA